MLFLCASVFDWYADDTTIDSDWAKAKGKEEQIACPSWVPPKKGSVLAGLYHFTEKTQFCLEKSCTSSFE
jgi:hypothetical protein